MGNVTEGDGWGKARGGDETRRHGGHGEEGSGKRCNRGDAESAEEDGEEGLRAKITKSAKIAKVGIRFWFWFLSFAIIAGFAQVLERVR
jgi:hypothetical protein